MFPIKIVHVPIRTTNVHHVGLLKNISFLLVKKKKNKYSKNRTKYNQIREIALSPGENENGQQPRLV